PHPHAHQPRGGVGPVRRQPGDGPRDVAPGAAHGVHQPGRHRPRKRLPAAQGERAPGPGIAGRPANSIDRVDTLSAFDRVCRVRFEPAAPRPPTRAAFQVLVALADSEKHGYAIIKEVARRSEGKVQLRAGTLYAVIERLVEAGLIVESADRPDPALDDERR